MKSFDKDFLAEFAREGEDGDACSSVLLAEFRGGLG